MVDLFLKNIFVAKKIRRRVNLKGKKVVVMGIGLHGGGVSMIKWLAQQGAKVVATDKKTKEMLVSSLKKISKLIKNKKIKLVVGQHRIDDFRSADLIVKNPSVPWDNIYIKRAKKNNIPVEMDSSLFFKLSPSKNIIGITGTKGKTTTSYIIRDILEEAGKKVVLVGAGTLTVMDRLSLVSKNSYIIFELSSWRLSALGKKKISPRYAVVTNVYPDHLNYYKTMERYIADKKIIVKYQKKNDLAVLNYDNELTRNFANDTRAEISFFSIKDSDSIIQDVYLENDVIKYRTDSAEDVICEIKDLKVLGRHNVYNIMAGVALALRLNIPVKTIRKAIINFKGIKHRLELVEEKKGVLFYNDSAATTPEAAIAGIRAFLNRAEAYNIYLIAGGSSKNLDQEKFVQEMVEVSELKKVVLLKGEATDKIIKALKKLRGEKLVLTVVDNMSEAVNLLYEEVLNHRLKDKKNSQSNKQIYKQKSIEEFRMVNRISFQSKDVILLSPGCASFGLFNNEFDRGDQFKESVKNL